MKIRDLILAIAFVGMGTSAWAVGPLAIPEEISKTSDTGLRAGVTKAFGDPTDLKAAAIAAADYVRYMQADLTEDNAGNGSSDTDPDDAGWDWVLTTFEHSTGISAPNIYGTTALGMLEVYAFNPDPALMTAMQDVADQIVLLGPAVARSAADVVFLMDFAALPGIATPLLYQQGAADIWQYRLDTNTAGQTATEYAVFLRDIRGVTQNYPNGIIAWDLAPWVTGLMKLDAVFGTPTTATTYATYGAQAVEIAEVLYQDSIMLAPGLFDVHGRNKNYDPAWGVRDYWWYTLGVTGLIDAFVASGTHLGEIPALETVLLECQYADGAFSYQYGAHTDIDDTDWQSTAYGALSLSYSLAATPANLTSIFNAGVWMAGTQDATGGFVYSSGNHYPQTGGQVAAGLAVAHVASASSVTVNRTFSDPAQCGVIGDVSFNYVRSAATPGLFGYEMVISITGGVDPVVIGDFVPVVAMDFFRVDANLDGTFTVNASRFGADPGLLVDAELFYIDLTTATESTVTVNVDSYRMRDSVNVPLFADMIGQSFVVDCTNPLPVANVTAAPRHNKVDVTWAHNGDDTITYEIYRGLWYDGAVGNSAYPEYDDLAGNTIPTRPADRDAALASAEWIYAGAVAVGTNTFTDIGAIPVSGGTFDAGGDDRGVYYYEVFTVDAALNASIAAPANDRATNYWLGDIAPMDGYVTANSDINDLGAAFATSDGDLSYNNVADVGPTDDWSGKGIPLTDSLIDFEDLMVFALNFSVVGPAKTDLTISKTVELAWVKRDDGRWALHLISGAGVQGLHVRANLPEGSVNAVEAGELLTSQSELPFLINVGSKLDVNLALMGQGAHFVGSGELFVVDALVDIKASDLTIDARAIDNSRLEYAMERLTGNVTPLVFSLGANFPNPFNPMTKISFSLPATQSVELVVYSLDGRRVATLLNETRSAGEHDVVWMGRDDAGRAASSGTYFYRLNAGPYSQVRKMTLMK